MEYKNPNNKLGRLIKDFCCKDPSKMNSKLLADRMRYLKSTETEMNSMCKIMEDYGDKRFADGMNQITRMNAWLKKANRTDDLLRSFDDNAFQQQLLAEYQATVASV